jgi:hypothetical protein
MGSTASRSSVATSHRVRASRRTGQLDSRLPRTGWPKRLARRSWSSALRSQRLSALARQCRRVPANARPALIAMLSNIAIFLMAPVVLIAGIIYAKRAALGRRPNRLLPKWALVALVAACGMYAVALAPLLVFLLHGPHPEFQRVYYSSLLILALVGWVGTLASVLWESIGAGPSWSALGIAGWATVTFLGCRSRPPSWSPFRLTGSPSRGSVHARRKCGCPLAAPTKDKVTMADRIRLLRVALITFGMCSARLSADGAVASGWAGSPASTSTSR